MFSLIKLSENQAKAVIIIEVHARLAVQYTPRVTHPLKCSQKYVIAVALEVLSCTYD